MHRNELNAGLDTEEVAKILKFYLCFATVKRKKGGEKEKKGTLLECGTCVKP